MSIASEHFDPADVGDRLREASAATPELAAEVIARACRRFQPSGKTAKSARIEELIEARAWTEVALALIDLELPLWQIRRLTYDAGEWYCSLSRQRELPDWLDQSVEARHANLTLALLCAFTEAQAIAATSARPSVPLVPRTPDYLCEPFCCDNFS
jgi:hypothetical protein